METETITFHKSALRPKFFYIADLVDEVSNVFPSEIINPQECPKDLLFKADPRNPHILKWHVWLKPTSLKFPYFEGLCGDCLDINLGPIQDDGLGLFRLTDRWIMLSGGNADHDDDLIYGKEIDGRDPHQKNALICRLMQLIQVAAMNSATLPPSNTLIDVVKISAQAPPLGGAILLSFTNSLWD